MVRHPGLGRSGAFQWGVKVSALLDMSPWRRAVWSIPVTMAIVLFWPVPVAHPEAHPLLVVLPSQTRSPLRRCMPWTDPPRRGCAPGSERRTNRLTAALMLQSSALASDTAAA